MANLLNPTLILVAPDDDRVLGRALAPLDDIPVRRVTPRTLAELDAHLTCSQRGGALVPLGIIGSLDGDEWVLNSTVKRVAECWTGVPLAVTARRRPGRLELLLDQMGYGAPVTLGSEDAITKRIARWDQDRRNQRRVAEGVAASHGLTARPEQVCVAIHFGCRRGHLPAALGIGEPTVATHLTKIYGVTGATNFEGVVGLLNLAARRQRRRIAARRGDE